MAELVFRSNEFKSVKDYLDANHMRYTVDLSLSKVYVTFADTKHATIISLKFAHLLEEDGSYQWYPVTLNNNGMNSTKQN